MTTALVAPADAQVGAPGGSGGWRAATAYWLTVYKRTWRGTVTSSILEPILFLLAMGVGVGKYVHGGGPSHGQVDGVRYLRFLAPGLLAAAAMQTAVGESTWPVLGSIKWRATYSGMLASPLSVADVMLGHFAYMVIRTAITAVAFAAVMLCFGAARHPAGLLLAVPAATLTGAAFAACIAAFAATVQTDSGFSVLYRFGVVPLFLFSGTFFPVDQLPHALRPVAYVTPLWHGVELCRDLVLGRGSAAGMLGHAAYLAVMLAGGLAVARTTYRRRLRW